MPNYTTNYNLKKPLDTENYNGEDQNGNMDIIDAQMKSIVNSIPSVPVSSVNTKTGAVVLSASDIKTTSGDTVESSLADMETHVTDTTKHITAEERIAWNAKQNALTISSATNSTSTTQVANSAAVKSAYDLANLALPKAGGTMTGVLTAQNNAAYTTSQARNIKADTVIPTTLANGEICLVYE
jgi:hypothetical protein